MGAYNCTDIEMLIASGMAMKHFRDNLDELGDERDDWNVGLVDAMDERIDNAWKTHMRTDYRADLRKSTDRVMELSEAARKALHYFKVQVENDFEKDVANDILTNLGFGRYYRKVGKKYQESLSGMLYAFQAGMTPERRSLVTSNGIKDKTIDTIIDYADDFKQANQIQEELKYNWHVPSSEAREELNGIYKDVIKICKIAAAYYSDNPAKKRLFTFTRLVASTNVRGTKEEEIPPEVE